MSVPARILAKRWPWWLAALLIVAGYVATRVEIRFPEVDPRPPGGAAEIETLRERSDTNVLFILIDTLRAERLGAWGYERDTSPLLDRLASGGVRFGRQLAQSSWTKCSMASLWTGLYPVRSGVTRFQHVLPSEAEMPAEIFKRAGFRTAGLYRNGWVEGYFGFDQGFDVYTRPIGRPAPASVQRKNPTIKEVGTDADAVPAAIEFLRVYGDERWFLYLHMMDVHEYMYDEDSALFGTTYSDIYDNAIRRENLVLAELYRYLRDEGHLEHTLIVIAADHGEAFGERDFEGHARRVYRETTEVPFILSFPFRLEPGVVVRSRTRNIDIWPTLLDLLGLPALPDADGRSRRNEILAAVNGESLDGGDEPSFAYLDQTWGQRRRGDAPTVAVSVGDYRYVLTRDEQGRESDELFDASDDPKERDEVGAAHPDVVERLRAQALDFLQKRPPWREEVRSLEMDEIQLNQLRALGYAVP